MKFQFIANACGIFTNKAGKKILCDPWIEDGVFEGSWCHFHPLKTTREDFKDVDAIYVSHVHPDHYDDRFFDYPKNLPIITLDQEPNFLIKILKRKGHSNILGVKEGQTIEFAGFSISMFGPFAKHHFHEAEVGNIIDSAMVIQADGVTCFNANDNAPTAEAMKSIAQKFGSIDLAMVTYNAAGPYPACFDNLNDDEKRSAGNQIIQRNLEYMKDALFAAPPKYVLPFAGAYVLGGKYHVKNDLLGTATWDEAAEYLRKHQIPCEVICLREKDTFDLITGSPDRPYEPINTLEMKRYVQHTLSKIKYPYEHDEFPDPKELLNELEQTRIAFTKRIEKYGLKLDMDVTLKVFGQDFTICKVENKKGDLKCSMDERLLYRILKRKANWNNAENGCHIRYYREPNHYFPDLHVALQFFHL